MDTTTATTVRQRRLLRALGPGFIIAATTVGPGSLVLASTLGATSGYAFLWILPASGLFLCTYLVLAVSVTLKTGRSITNVIEDHYGRGWAILVAALPFLSLSLFSIGNLIGSASALQALIGGRFWYWVAATAVIAVAFFLLHNAYKVAVKFFLVAVLVMFAAFLGTLFVTGVDGGDMARGLVPGIPATSLAYLALGMAATTFVPFLAFSASVYALDQRWGPAERGEALSDQIMAVVVTALLTSMVLITAATTLNKAGVIPQGVGDLAIQLEPLAGPAARYIFAVGLFAASITSVIGAPLMGATILVNGIRPGTRVSERKHVPWALGMIGLAVAVVLATGGQNPVQAIVLVQGLTAISIPVIGFFVPFIAQRRTLLGELALPRWVIALAWLGYLVLLLLMANVLRSLIQTVSG